MNVRVKSVMLSLCICISFVLLLCYPYIQQIDDPPPLYPLVVDFCDNRLSYDIVKSSYEQLSEKGYKVKTENDTVTIKRKELEITLKLDKGVDKNFEPRIRYFHNVSFIIDTVKYRYSEQGLSMSIDYTTTIFSKEPVVLNLLQDLYNDLNSHNAN